MSAKVSTYDHGLRGDVLYMTDRIKHFDDTNFAVFKRSLLEELGCRDDRTFVCKIMGLFCKILSNGQIQKLSKLARAISNQQLVTAKHPNPKTKSINDAINNKYQDNLSNLPNEVFVHMSSYLSKRESVEIGVLNKYVYH